jgi:hypothetical protein
VYSESDLTITKTATSGPIYANGNTGLNTVTFTITVSNLGPSDAHNVHVDDPLNSNLLTSALYCLGASCTPSTTYSGSITIGTFTAPGSQTYKVAAHANATLGHSTASSGPPNYRNAGPYSNSNTATIVSTTSGNSPADSRGPTPAVNTEIDTVPSSPTIVQPAVGGNTQAAVEWNPSLSGGQPITSYTIKACDVSSPSSCVSRTVGPNPNAPPAPVTPTYFSYVISGLTNGVQYQFIVVATNAVGDSDSADAGTAWASTSAFVAINTTGTLSADTGFSSGALTCSDPTLATCKDIVAQYQFPDPNIGAAYNLDAEPNAAPSSAAAQLAFFRGAPLAPTPSASPTPLLQCYVVGSLDPTGQGYASVVPSDCGPSNKVIRGTYPTPSNTSKLKPHLEQEQFDSSITTFTRGAPCFAYTVDNTGTAQCTDPSYKAIYTDPNTRKLTNFCPAQFNSSSTTGYSKQAPCTFVYYLVVKVPGFDISGTVPVPCTSGATCGQPTIIGSSVRAGITQNRTQFVRPWCNTSSKNPIPTVYPCINQYKWLNGDSSSSPNYFDLIVQDYEAGDLLKGGSSG